MTLLHRNRVQTIPTLFDRVIIMRTRPRFGLMSLALLAVLAFPGFFAAPQAQADSSVDVDIHVFHDALAPYGNWVHHRTYGQVWYPRNVARDWRPYTDGYWAHTDEYGWLWVANEPWGWAPFHYGRWAWDNWYGWIWVPGRTWAPAWVFWRSGGGYAAWAPMPPNVVWQPGIGLNISYFNYDRDLSWDSWVAVREYDLPHRHMNRHIFPPRQNRQIINVTNHTRNVTLINNSIVNQGVPVKQIEQITHQPVIPVVPTLLNKMDATTPDRGEGQPSIIRLPMAGPTPEDLHHHEELARRLDGKRPDGTRTALPVAPNSGQPDEPRVPGRLSGAPVQSPQATPEQPIPAMTAPEGEALPQAAIPETPLVGLGLDSDTHHTEHDVRRNREARLPDQSEPQPSADMQQTVPIPIQPQAAGGSAPVPATDRQSVSSETAAMPPLQNELQSAESAKQHDTQPLQAPVVDQPQIEKQPTENIQRQQPLQQPETAGRQEMQVQQQIEAHRQQAERARENAQQMQQQEAARQQEMQVQQQIEAQRQQAEQARKETQQKPKSMESDLGTSR